MCSFHVCIYINFGVKRKLTIIYEILLFSLEFDMRLFSEIILAILSEAKNSVKCVTS